MGVLDVQSTQPNAFIEEDATVLQTMADQLAIAIDNARQYEELKRTQVQVGSLSALVWMGMASNAWRHTIDKNAQTISEQASLLSKDLAAILSPDKNPHLVERLTMIQRLATQIKEKPITPPLSTEEGVTSVPVNGLIRERVKQLWENEPYKSIDVQTDLSLDDMKTVRASSEWLRRALDILIDNAVTAMAGCPRRKITIQTDQENDKAIILVNDSGKGIPADTRPHLFIERIQKPEGSKGLGMGLLMAQAIVQTYGGDIAVQPPGLVGATFCIKLPIEVEKA
jgi:signal transduction histidine kinase